jgi:hypothetical protein
MNTQWQKCKRLYWKTKESESTLKIKYHKLAESNLNNKVNIVWGLTPCSLINADHSDPRTEV